MLALILFSGRWYYHRFFFSLTWVASGYICELALSSLYNVHSVSLCLPCCFLYLPGHCYLSSARAPVITGMVTSFLCVLDPLRPGFQCRGRGTETHRHICHIKFCKVHSLQHDGLRERIPSLNAATAQLPVTVGASVVRRAESRVLVPLLLLGSLKLLTQLQWSEGPGLQAPILLPLVEKFCLLSFPSFSPLIFRSTYMWEFSSILLCWEKHPCWVVDVLLGVDWRETKVAFHSVMFLTSPLLFFIAWFL